MVNGLAQGEELSHLEWYDNVPKKHPIAKNDKYRCEVVESYQLMAPDEEKMFDQLCDLARKIFDVKYAAVSMVSRDIAYLTGESGGLPRVFPRNIVLCNYAIKKGSSLLIPDASRDAAYLDEPDVTVHGMRFFCAVPLITSEQIALGTFCVADPEPRENFGPQLPKLQQLASLVMREIEFRRLRRENTELKAELQRLHHIDRSQLPETNITALFSDIEGSTPLWEFSASAMKEALALHNSIIRSAVAECHGFETATEGDAFLVVFHYPSDAVRCSLLIQEKLLQGDWPEKILTHPLCAKVTLADGAVLFNGLRVRIGLHTGEPIYVSKSSQPASSTTLPIYYGSVVQTAKRVAEAAHGGQIIMTEAVWQQLQAFLRESNPPEVIELGRHVLHKISMVHCLRQVLPQSLRALDHAGCVKGRTFPKLKTEKQLTQSFWDAPRGRVSLVFGYIEGKDSIEQTDVVLLQSILAAVKTVASNLLSECDGYECSPDPTILMSSFQNTLDAMKWCMLTQQAMHTVTWSPQILSHPACATVRSEDGLDVMFRGARLQMGIYTAEEVAACPDPISGAARYHGVICNRAARVAVAARGGQILIGGTLAIAELSSNYHNPPFCRIGAVRLKGIEEPIELAEMTMFRRKFPPLKPYSAEITIHPLSQP